MTLTRRIASPAHAGPERRLLEQRLFPKSDRAARVVRLRPATRLVALGGIALVFGWAIIATAILAIDAVGAGPRDQMAGAQAAFEERLHALAAERDARAAEAAAAQQRFAAALDQVSDMQSQLIAAEQQRRELEAGLGVVQANLAQALAERAKAAERETAAAPEAADRTEELTLALDILSGELDGAAAARTKAERLAVDAQRQAEDLAVERDAIVARHDKLFAQIEDAVELSVKPFDKMFASAGLDTDRLLSTVRAGYSGQGGPLTPMGRSTRGNAAITEDEARANDILISLDKLNTYRIAASKMPLSMPVQSAFRYTSNFGARWGRKHEGIDMAAPVGTPVYATGDGTVIFAGWQRGYGNVIKIQHELGTETRYGHLSKLHVRAGQQVSRGARIGDMGNTGRSTGPHLHYEVRVNGRAVDPLSFIKAAQNVF